jgi:hypothetical protein
MHHWKKTGAIKSGERGGQVVSQNPGSKGNGNITLRKIMLALAVGCCIMPLRPNIYRHFYHYCQHRRQKYFANIAVALRIHGNGMIVFVKETVTYLY